MTAPAPAPARLRIITDARTGETVFGPATQAQVSDWIIQDGFWRGADLRVQNAPSDWANPLSRDERRTLALSLTRACRLFYAYAGVIGRRGDNNLSRALVDTSADMADLHLDVTQRAEAAQ